MTDYKRKTLLFKNPVYSIKGCIPNQNVNISYASNVITVTSLQGSSTPGARFGAYNIPKGEFYEFVVKGKTLGSASAYLWADKSSDNTRVTAITTESTTFLPNEESGSVSAVIGGFNCDTKVRVGILFDDPSENDQFQIESIALIQREAVKLGEWSIYDMPSNLVINSKNNSGEWKFVGAFVKN